MSSQLSVSCRYKTRARLETLFHCLSWAPLVDEASKSTPLFSHQHYGQSHFPLQPLYISGLGEENPSFCTHCSMSASLHYTIMNPQCQKYWTPSSLASIWLDFQSGGLLPGKVWIEPAGQAPEWSGFSSLIGFQISFVYAMAISHSLFPLIAPMMCRMI